MAWSRMGDNILTHPKLSRLLTAANFDHSLKNEAFGALALLVSVCAAHLTDYYVEYGLVAQIAPGREKKIIDLLVEAALVERCEVDGRKILKICEDHEFFHNRSREEVEIDRRRERDRRNPELYIGVRVRDGDQCRWCGKTVSWADRKSARAATLDSLTSHQDSTVETLVVACKSCNSRRGAGEELQLRPEPSRSEVYYTDSTIRYVNEHQWSVENGIQIEPRQTRINLESLGSSSMGSPSAAAAPASAAARGGVEHTRDAVQYQDPLEDAPDWVREGMLDYQSPQQREDSAAAAPVLAAARGDLAAARSAEEAKPSGESLEEVFNRVRDTLEDCTPPRSEEPVQEMTSAAAAPVSAAARGDHLTATTARVAHDLSTDAHCDSETHHTPQGVASSSFQIPAAAASTQTAARGEKKEPHEVSDLNHDQNYNDLIKPVIITDHQGHGSGSLGSGRVGSDLAGSGLDGKRRRRGKRGKRN